MHNSMLDGEVRALVGQAIAVRRAQLGMSQAEAAVLLGWHQPTLCRLERVDGCPAVDQQKVPQGSRREPKMTSEPALGVFDPGRV